mmetsp:Transcript_76376/g.212169  ORF Transcript_76376/g.212169 Transcript_76376/m.212169 type:complete len:233 (+) Transcript_76376:124-822(+)|eukprot:CAMPEP_0117499312 /NCGR_PEP_ID=MMETSP0784-20121206/22181_1 /TAXON_ID=39447 /ORGANISM="" /LENGTH=232 /DNA_ID=CAMNT_0005294457 /DNA_START=109 /DNA_END=807 /DNA_ORIENTATION=-
MVSLESDTLEDTVGGEKDVFVNKDVTMLFLRWRNEKFAPELLPFDNEVANSICEVVEFVAETLDEERSDGNLLDPNDPDYFLRCVDLERVKYVFRDYLRIRLWKLGQWPQHYLEPANMALLSDAERIYLRDIWNLRVGFFEHRLLGALPQGKRGLEDQIDLLHMVRRPDLDKHVFVRIIADIGAIDVPPTLSQDGSTVQPLSLNEGNTYLLRYSIIRQFLMEPKHDGKVELV